MDIYNEYFEWLCSLVDFRGLPGSPYYIPLRVMYETEFKVLIPNDINRADDGVAFRKEFCTEKGYQTDIFNNEKEPCTVLEMLIGLSDRMAWEMLDSNVDSYIGRWFREILDNLGIRKNTTSYQATEIIRIANNREYDEDGIGGYFPIKMKNKQVKNLDEKRLEIWYQMQRYLIANF